MIKDKAGDEMFINFTNHTSSKWSDAQLQAAKEYGSIFDIQFPSIEPQCTRADIQRIADEYAKQIIDKSSDCVCAVLR